MTTTDRPTVPDKSFDEADPTRASAGADAGPITSGSAVPPVLSVSDAQVRAAYENARHVPSDWSAPVEPSGQLWRERDKVLALLTELGVEVRP